MAENTKNDEGFRVPQVDWTRSARRVLTLEWIDGIPIADRDALAAAGHDVKALGALLMQTFLRHAMRDGFFHADMHPGNLFVDDQGRIVAVDFGIMGRLGMKERRFLAEILYGFFNRNYQRVAEVHFEAGYVPRKHSVAQFAQALRAIGEPIMDRPASEISMAQLLGQLFQYTEVFDMQTRPELLLLQKTMVVVEGVGRTPRSRAEYVGRVRAGGEGVDGADLRRGRPVRGRGGRRGVASAASWARSRSCSARPSARRKPCPPWPRRACGSTTTRLSGWPRRRPARTGQAASASGSARSRSRPSRSRCSFELVDR